MIQIEDYDNMINKAAWKAAKATGQEFEDLQAQGRVVFYEALTKFDPGRGIKFSTFLHHQLRGYLVQYNRDQGHVGPLREDLISGAPDPARTVEFRDQLSRLSDEAQEVVQAIFQAPNEIIEDANINLSKFMRGNIRRKLLANGWKSWKIAEVFNEIRAVLA